MPEGKRKRATRIDVKLAREATHAVRTIRSKISDWQRRAAHLSAIAAHRRAAGESLDAILTEATYLAREIELHQQLLDERAASLPEPVRNHSRFQDIVRALSTASRVVDGVRHGPSRPSSV